MPLTIIDKNEVYDKNNTLLSCMLVCDSNNDGVYDSFTYSSNGLTHEGGLNGERKVKEISTNRYKAVDINDNGIVDDGEIKGL